MERQIQNVKHYTPPPEPEDWRAYDQLKRRIREVYPPDQAEQKIKRLLDIVQM